MVDAIVKEVFLDVEAQHTPLLWITRKHYAPGTPREQARKPAWARGEAPERIASAVTLFDQLPPDAQMDAIRYAENILKKGRP